MLCFLHGISFFYTPFNEVETTIFGGIMNTKKVMAVADILSQYATMLKSGASMKDIDMMDEGIDGIARMIERLEELGVKIERKE